MFLATRMGEFHEFTANALPRNPEWFSLAICWIKAVVSEASLGRPPRLWDLNHQKQPEALAMSRIVVGRAASNEDELGTSGTWSRLDNKKTCRNAGFQLLSEVSWVGLELTDLCVRGAARHASQRCFQVRRKTWPQVPQAVIGSGDR